MPENCVDVSIVIATYNRSSQIVELLHDLRGQELGERRLEIIVVNDGSSDETRPVLERFAMQYFPTSQMDLVLLHQKNQGQSVARQTGVSAAQGRVLIFMDDDIRLPATDFVLQHLKHHEADGNRVVLGRILPPPSDGPRPAFEYFYERALERMYTEFDSGQRKPQGLYFFTGNVSVTRAAFLNAGGFSSKFRYAEDKELGLRIEARTGAQFVYESGAICYHYSTAHSFASFARRAHYYGLFDCEMQGFYPDRPDIGPHATLAAGGRLRKALCALLLRSATARFLVATLFRFLAAGAQKMDWREPAADCCAMVYLANYASGVHNFLRDQSAMDKNGGELIHPPCLQMAPPPVERR